jgi:hypothetical protein
MTRNSPLLAFLAFWLITTSVLAQDYSLLENQVDASTIGRDQKTACPILGSCGQRHGRFKKAVSWTGI